MHWSLSPSVFNGIACYISFYGRLIVSLNREFGRFFATFKVNQHRFKEFQQFTPSTTKTKLRQDFHMPHTSLHIQFLNKENISENDRFLFGDYGFVSG